MKTNKKKIKLIHIITSLEQGGAQEVLYQLLYHLDHTQFEHHVVYFHGGPYVQQIQALNIPVHHISGWFSSYDPGVFIRMYCLLKKMKPDVVHASLWLAQWVSRIMCWWLQIPVIAVLHNNIEQNGKRRRFLDWLTINFPAQWVAVSPQVRTGFLKCFPHCKVDIIYNGVAEVSTQKNASGSLVTEGIILGTVGRLVPLKNHYLFIDVCAELRARGHSIYGIVLGDGPLEYELKRYAHQCGLEHSFRCISGQKAWPFYTYFDYFLMTSAFEGVSMALLEAMGWGVPPIVMSAHDQHPVITHGLNGFVVSAGDIGSMVSYIEDLIQHDSRKRQIAAQAIQTIHQQFSAERMAQDYAQIFRAKHATITRM